VLATVPAPSALALFAAGLAVLMVRPKRRGAAWPRQGDSISPRL